MTTYDVSRLSPAKFPNNMMRSALQHLQKHTRTPIRNWRGDVEQAGFEIQPVVFGSYVVRSLFGKCELDTPMDVLFDMQGQKVVKPDGWERQNYSREALEAEMKTDANRCGYPDFLKLVGVYQLPDTIEHTVHGRTVKVPFQQVRLFAVESDIAPARLLGAIELTAQQALFNPEQKLRYSKSFRVHLEQGFVCVAAPGKLSRNQLKAAEGRGKELATMLGLRLARPVAKAPPAAAASQPHA